MVAMSTEPEPHRRRLQERALERDGSALLVCHEISRWTLERATAKQPSQKRWTEQSQPVEQRPQLPAEPGAPLALVPHEQQSYDDTIQGKYYSIYL
eukprot:5548320-Pleurochrysis_carterae.AAC.1